MRDYAGVPFSPVKDPIIRNSLAAIDYFLRDLSRGMGRIQQGEIPDGSGTSISSVLDLDDYLFLPGRLGGQMVRGVNGDTAPTVVLNTAAAGTSTIGAVGTPMLRLTYASTTLAEFQPLLFNGGLYDLTIKPTNALALTGTDGTAGFRFAAVSNRSFLQVGILNSGGSVQNPNLTVGGLGATYGSSLAFAFAEAYFDAGASVLKVGMGPNLNPASFGGSWRGTLAIRAPDASNGALILAPGGSGGPYLECYGTISAPSTYNSRLMSLEADSITSLGKYTLWGTTSTRAGSLATVAGFSSGHKVSIIDRNSTRAFAVDSISGQWADTKTAFFLELGESVSSFKAATLCSKDNTVLDRFHITALNALWSDAALSASTVIPGALLHLRNTASASKVVQRIQPHGSQSADIWQVRDSADSTTLQSVDSAGTFVSTGNGGGASMMVDSDESSGSAYDGLGFLLNGLASGFKAKISVPTSLAQDTEYALPAPSADFMRLLGTNETATVTNKAFSVGCRVRCGTAAADSNAVIFDRGGSATRGFRFNNSAIGTSTIRDLDVQNLNGTVPIVGNDPPSVASGALGKVDLTAQSAAITSTNLSSTPPAGFYLIHYEITCTTGDATAGTIQLDITATGDGGSQTTSSAALSLTTATLSATNPIRGTMERYVASGDIAYAMPVTGAVNAARFAVRIRVVALG